MFKKGHIPWNKGRKGLQKGYWLGKKRPNMTGKNHPLWKGEAIGAKGYIFIKQPFHPRADINNYVKRANLVMEKHIGRYLKKGEIVHHKGIKFPIHSIKNRQDDRIENLQLFVNDPKHRKYHNSL